MQIAPAVPAEFVGRARVFRAKVEAADCWRMASSRCGDAAVRASSPPSDPACRYALPCRSRMAAEHAGSWPPGSANPHRAQSASTLSRRASPRAISGARRGRTRNPDARWFACRCTSVPAGSTCRSSAHAACRPGPMASASVRHQRAFGDRQSACARCTRRDDRATRCLTESEVPVKDGAGRQGQRNHNAKREERDYPGHAFVSELLREHTMSRVPMPSLRAGISSSRMAMDAMPVGTCASAMTRADPAASGKAFLHFRRRETVPGFSLLAGRSPPLAHTRRSLAQRRLRNILLAAGVMFAGVSAALGAGPAIFDITSTLDGLTALKYWEQGGNLTVTQYMVSSGFQFCDLSVSSGRYTDRHVEIGVTNSTPPQALIVYNDDRLTRRPAGSLRLAMQVDDNSPFVVTLAHAAAQYATARVNGRPTDFEPLVQQLSVGQTLTLSLTAPSANQ